MQQLALTKLVGVFFVPLSSTIPVYNKILISEVKRNVISDFGDSQIKS